jgi:transposase InsO family protein
LRSEAIAIDGRYQEQGATATTVAELLEVPARTLRHWRQMSVGGIVPARALGRPQARCPQEQAREVVSFLQGQGPWVGVAVLRGAFPAAPRAELRELLAVFRYLWACQHPRERQELHWLRVGAVWALDFTEVTGRIDGHFRYVLAVRDLASGLQLCWRPVADLSVAPVLAELGLLFTLAGAPLVLKSDNGPAFRAGVVKRLLRRWGVWPLYSPPGRPGYNGAIEASIGSLKRRTQYAAYRAGHGGDWTSGDVDEARQEANGTARPRGPRGMTPAQAWECRQPPTGAEREQFAALVRQQEAASRRQEGIAEEAVLEHYEQAALHRRVLTQVLVERGLLTITRRRIPQRFFGRKVANIT